MIIEKFIGDEEEGSGLLLSSESAEEFFLSALEAGCEGIMAKSLEEGSRYRAGARGWQWIKFKADYATGLIDSFDLVVVGGYHGRGRRTGWYGAFLMAVFDHETGMLETLCKLGSGFNDKQLQELTDELQESIIEEPPGDLTYVKVPDVWFEPTIVLEVKGAELSLSPDHTTYTGKDDSQKGFALRFPRYTGIRREDKTYEDATTSEEVFKMFSLQKKRTSGQ